MDDSDRHDWSVGVRGRRWGWLSMMWAASPTEAGTAGGTQTMPLRKSTVLAGGDLVWVLGVALGIALGLMAGIGPLRHAFDLQRHFDTLYALFKELVVGFLIALCVLWLLPSRPWARRLIEPADREQPVVLSGKAEAGGAAWACGAAEVGGPGRAAALSLYLGRGPPHLHLTSRTSHRRSADDMTTL